MGHETTKMLKDRGGVVETCSIVLDVMKFAK